MRCYVVTMLGINLCALVYSVVRLSEIDPEPASNRIFLCVAGLLWAALVAADSTMCRAPRLDAQIDESYSGSEDADDEEDDSEQLEDESVHDDSEPDVREATPDEKED